MSRGLPSTVRYQSRIFHRDAGWKFRQQDRGCWMENISTQHQPVAPHIESSVICPFQRLSFRYALIYEFSSISRYAKTSRSHSPLINGRVKLLAKSSWPFGCWVEVFLVGCHLMKVICNILYIPIQLSQYTPWCS